MARSGVRPSPRDQLARRTDFRVGRGIVIGLALLGISSAGHASGGGVVAAPALLLASVAAVLVGIALSDREWRLPRLLVVLAGGQVVLHVALSAGHGGAHAGDHAASGADARMLMGHAVALVLVAVALRRGEDLVWRVAASLGSPLLATVGAGVRLVCVPAALTRAGIKPRARDLVRHDVVRRGPPAGQHA